MLTNPRTSIAGSAGALLLALFAFLGPEPISWQRAAVLIAGCLAIAALGIFSRDHAVRPSVPLAGPVGPSVVVLERVARGELSPEEGARALEAGRERRPVDVVSFEDAGRATQRPNARGDK